VELLNGKYFARMIEGIRKVFDYIIIDTPPLGSVTDAAVIAPNCDGVIIVMAENMVRCRQAEEVVEQLKRADARILGVVRNSVHGKSQEYFFKK
jgi:Mrp family chromosome partitioning ATPase